MKATALEFRFRFAIHCVLFVLGFAAPWDYWLHLDGTGPNAHLWGSLAASIRATGVVQPVVVRELPGGRFQLIMGERRWRASEAAGKTTIPAIVRQVSDEQAMEMTIVENLQRADLNPMEQARAFDRLGREFKMTQEQIATRTGKDRASVGNFIRLLKLPASIQQTLHVGLRLPHRHRQRLHLPRRRRDLLR